MVLRTLILPAVLLFGHPSPVAADDKAPAIAPPGTGPQAARMARILSNPNDAKALKAYLETADLEIRTLINYFSDPTSASQKQEELAAILVQLKPTLDEAKGELDRAQREFQSRALFIEIERATLPDLEKNLLANPNDFEGYRRWYMKQGREFQRIMRSDPDAAKRRADADGKIALEIRARTTNDKMKRGPGMPDPASRIEQARAAFALVGHEPPAFSPLVWVNGDPTSLADLKGKVIVLHACSVTGYEVAGLPRVREWQDKFSNRGLAVISLVGLQNSTWNDEEHSFKSDNGPDLPKLEEFQASLQKMSAFYGLKQRVAILGPRLSREGSPLLREALTIIDRQGKIDMIRLDPWDKEAREVGSRLAELLAEPK